MNPRASLCVGIKSGSFGVAAIDHQSASSVCTAAS
jgi:hypothetical protein